MVSFLAIWDWRATLASWGWWFIWLTFFGTVALALFEHRKLKEDVDAASGRKKTIAQWKLGLLWVLPILSLIAAAASQWGSEKAERKITSLESDLREEHASLTNALNTVAGLEPRHQPIMTISANAHFTIRGLTNTYNWNYSDPGAVAMGVASLQCGRLESVGTNVWQIFLKAEKFVSFGGGDEWDYYMDFIMDPVHPMSNVRSNDPAGLLDELNAVAIQAHFLRMNPEVLGGRITLTINSAVRKQLLIPPQRPFMPVITVAETNGCVSTFGIGQGGRGTVCPVVQLTNRYFF